MWMLDLALFTHCWLFAYLFFFFLRKPLTLNPLKRYLYFFLSLFVLFLLKRLVPRGGPRRCPETRIPSDAAARRGTLATGSELRLRHGQQQQLQERRP
jgi:hypothetical protein